MVELFAKCVEKIDSLDMWSNSRRIFSDACNITQIRFSGKKLRKMLKFLVFIDKFLKFRIGPKFVVFGVWPYINRTKS